MGALAIASRPLAVLDQEADFHLHGIRVFTSIPKRGHDVVVLRGSVIVYDTDAHHYGETEDGGFYVVERQRPPSLMPWESWLKHELRDAGRCAGPISRLVTTREVIQAVRIERKSCDSTWHYRLPGGFCDGPLYDWAVGMDFVGKVVGIYKPN
jgi:hypothetical protein